MECQFIKDVEEIKSDTKLIFFACDEEFSYEKEISGDKSFSSKLSKLSAQKNAVVFVRLSTDLFGLKSKSLMVYDKGMLLGIFDEMNCFNSKEINVLDTSIGRFCLLIETDIYIDGIIQIIQSFDPDYVVISIKDYLYPDAKKLNFNVTTYGITDLFLF